MNYTPISLLFFSVLVATTSAQNNLQIEHESNKKEAITFEVESKEIQKKSGEESLQKPVSSEEATRSPIEKEGTIKPEIKAQINKKEPLQEESLQVLEKPINLANKEGSLEYIITEADRTLFQRNSRLGHVKDNTKNSFRRLVQRTLMPTESKPYYGAVLTFDDQIVPASPDHASALEVAQDLQKVGARAIFFANIPGVDSHSVQNIARKKISFEQKKQECRALLESKRAVFVKAAQELLRLKNAPNTLGQAQYTCEVYNHTAFHQDLLAARADSSAYKLGLLGIEFVEECLDEAYEQERPGWQRARYFRFPFLHVPKNREAQELLDLKFSELGLISLGETQDSKDVHNENPERAYLALKAAQKGRRYNPAFGGVYSRADQPVALFHTKTWRKIGPGVLRAINESLEQRSLHEQQQIGAYLKAQGGEHNRVLAAKQTAEEERLKAEKERLEAQQRKEQNIEEERVNIEDPLKTVDDSSLPKGSQGMEEPENENKGHASSIRKSPCCAQGNTRSAEFLKRKGDDAEQTKEGY